MRTAPDLRYTDRDVREDDSLSQLVLNYLKVYGGEFDPLIRAQNMLEMDGCLTVPMTRTVLNCMRVDANVASELPAPRGYTMSNSLKRREPKKDERVPRILGIGGGYTHWHGQKYDLKCQLKFDYVINLHKQAKWFHKIDHFRTRMDFYPQDWPYDGRFGGNVFVLRELRGICGADLTRAVGVTKFLGTFEDAQESDNEFCPRCLFGHLDAEWKP